MNDYTLCMYEEDVKLTKDFLKKNAQKYLHNEDVIQTCVIRLWLNRKKFKGDSEYSTYVFQCLLNFIIDCHRIKNAKKRYAKMISLDTLIDSDDSLSDLIPDEHDHIKDAINIELAQYIIKKMNNKYIETIVEYISQGFTQDEISTILKISQQHVSKTFDKFRTKYLEEYYS